MPTVKDHPLRYQLSNELHARPFPSVGAGSRAVFLALKHAEGDVQNAADADLVHLIQLLDRYGTAHPQPGATHFSGPIGRHNLKWERHTEFVTYTLMMDGLGERPFDPMDFDVFPSDWLEAAQGTRMVSAMLRVEPSQSDTEAGDKLEDWFVRESLAASAVLDGAAIVASDFHIDPAGHSRFAVFAREGVGQGRLGRIVQRLFEIETYKSMSMLGFAQTREIGPQMGALDSGLTTLMGSMQVGGEAAERQLDELLRISTDLEALQAQTEFRFGATGAYEAIVNQRIATLRELPFEGRQTLTEFMMRRFDPAMRTVKSSQTRLSRMSERAVRASQLLRTRVDVDRSAQNQKLLESMDRRADMQFRLQETVEGLSVVAISYYAVSLASYLIYPLTGVTGTSKGILTALVTLPVVLIVWLSVRRLRKKTHG
ncbi:MAG: DUF3422 domain-containing protein [Planktotalea sp.]|uniref:DUF3422 family protein n=1 Tax=Planktotalea sp. TaxID=2029877 RepID=UPI003C721713